MEKLTLSNPITINGKKVKTLTYDTGAITVGMFAEAEALKLRATTHKAGGSAGATELDYSMHLYLAMMAITAVNPDIDIADLERISGPDVMELVRIGRNFTTTRSGAPSEQNDFLLEYYEAAEEAKKQRAKIPKPRIPHIRPHRRR